MFLLGLSKFNYNVICEAKNINISVNAFINFIIFHALRNCVYTTQALVINELQLIQVASTRCWNQTFEFYILSFNALKVRTMQRSTALSSVAIPRTLLNSVYWYLSHHEITCAKLGSPSLPTPFLNKQLQHPPPWAIRTNLI